jgi:deazaflavin-dependent oxidoreductase (nitroreductase family)
MSRSYADANPLHKAMRRLGATGPGSWFFARTLDHADRFVYRVTRGRTTLASVLSGLPVVMLTTTGARTGRRITTPILGVPEGDGVVVVASNYGRAHHPGWYHNLRADPHAHVGAGGEPQHPVTAHEVEGDERERLIRLATEVYPGFPEYVRRAAPRRIGVFRLIPS